MLINKLKNPLKIPTAIVLDRAVVIDLLNGLVIHKRKNIRNNLSPQELSVFCLLYNNKPALVTYRRISRYINTKAKNPTRLIHVIVVKLNKKFRSGGIQILSTPAGLRFTSG